jgi:Zn-finger nucleic acid-binding protein
MAKKAPAAIEVICPCCHARLKVDAALAVVLSHEPPPRALPDVDLTDAERILDKQAADREEKFRQSWESEKKKEDVLARKFEESLKKAREGPAEKPLRDFDLE